MAAEIARKGAKEGRLKGIVAHVSATRQDASQSLKRCCTTGGVAATFADVALHCATMLKGPW